MAFDPSRRVFIRGAGIAALGLGAAPSSLLVRAAQAAGAGTKVLVKVFLRGGADGLNLCAPYGESAYYDLRGPLALPRPGSAGGLLNLDGFFGLNPELGPLKALFDDGRLSFVHAVGNYALSRSHFDAQDFMESGTPAVKATPTGWLDRAIAALPGREVTQAVSFSSQQTRSFLGAEPVLVARDLAAFDLRARNWRSEAETLLRALYGAGDGTVGRVGLETFDAIRVLQTTPAIQASPANGAAYPAATVGRSLQQAAQIIKAGLGTRCIYVDVTGSFDTHSNQLDGNTRDYRPLGQALAAFTQDLGGRMDDVVLMVTTEFGRTAAVNGSLGTDHGSAYCMIVMGGGVRGGQVLGRWPGLSRSTLYQERDLAVTTDFRDVFQEVARAQLGIAESLFPGYTPGPGVSVTG